MAEHTPTMQPRLSGVSRRTLVKGAAWAVPVTAVVGAAPAFAVSGVVLEGFVEYRKVYDPATEECILEIDGRGSYPNRGLWIRNQPTPPSSAVATIYLTNPNWVSTNGQPDGWSNLVKLASHSDPDVPAGFTAYQTTYSGGWTTFGTAPNQRWEAATDPSFSGIDRDGDCEYTITTYVRRTITLDGSEHTVIRTQTF